jgi:hypothetical protein
MASGISNEHVVRAVERAGAQQLERGGRRGAEDGRACAQDDRPDDQVELVDQAGGQQVVPQRSAAEDKDVPTGPALELGDLLMGICATDDASGVAPRIPSGPV